MQLTRANRRRALCASAALAAALACTAPAFSQSLANAPAPAVFQSLDANGVDLTSGALVLGETRTSVGDTEQGGLSWSFRGAGARDNLSGSITATVYPDPYHEVVYFTVSLGGSSVVFRRDGAAYEQPHYDKGSEGASLTFDAGRREYTYTARDGTRAVFSGSNPTMEGEQFVGQLESVRRPDGETLTYHYQPGSIRLEAVSSSLGYIMKYEYAGTVGSADQFRLTRVAPINLAHKACNALAPSCDAAGFNPLTFTGATWGTGTFTATDSLGRTTTYTLENGRVRRMVRPDQTFIEVQYDANGRVSRYSDGAGAWTYVFSQSGDSLIAEVTDPSGDKQTVRSSRSTGQVTSTTDALGRTTTYLSDAVTGQLDNVIFPEGEQTEYKYDGRGNLTTVRQKARPNSGLADRVVTATYDQDPNCRYDTYVSPVCSRPSSITRDGATTNYSWDSLTGQLLTVTGPAGENGVRPQTRNRYETLTASFSDPLGQVSHNGVSRLVEAKSCIRMSSCAGTEDEVVQTYGYNAAANLRVSSLTVRDGANQASATTGFTYNVFGDVREVDGPLAGAVDVTRNRYDTARQLVGRIEADPDGQDTGRRARAANMTYTQSGQLFRTQYGSVPNRGDSGWSDFQQTYTVVNDFDEFGRVIRVRLRDSARTDQAITDYSYDAASRPLCETVRATAAYGDACTSMSAEDRITRYGYSTGSRLERVTSGLGRPEQSETVMTYRPGGALATLRDGEGALTTFEYDGFERLRRTRFPSKGERNRSSDTDYVENTYDPTTGNVTSQRLRDGQTVSLRYDARHNLVSQSATGGAYGYDNFNRMISATEGGRTNDMTYDALGRLTEARSPLGLVSYQYDAAGRRTRMTWPDTFAVQYEYSYADELLRIRDGGGTLLARFEYDHLGRRTDLVRGNNVATHYELNDLSQLRMLGNDAVSGGDQSVTLDYNRMGEIDGRSESNPAFRWTRGKLSQTNGYNTANQLTAVNGASVLHDDRGNVVNDTVNTFGFDASNRLTRANAATLSYDGLGRIARISGGALEGQWLYDGDDLVAEYSDGGALLRRYVHGPGEDEPLIVYDIAGGRRQWLTADERGSIVGITDDQGALTAINTYDEYGLPGANNQGRFQYTGQIWLADGGVYHHGARQYQPRFGRFLQPDPTGYDDGPNLYAYVGADPLNLVDLRGLEGVDLGGVDVTGERPPQPLNPGEGMQGGYAGFLVTPGSFATLHPAYGQGPSPSKAKRPKSRVRLPNLKPRTFMKHFIAGSGTTVCLTREQFDKAAATGEARTSRPRAGGGTIETRSYYNTDLRWTFGTATVYRNAAGRAVGFSDTYNFDAHARDTVKAQAMTAAGAVFYSVGGDDFEIRYGRGGC